MKILEEVKEKYNEGRNGEFSDFIVYFSYLDRGEDPEEKKKISDFIQHNLSCDELLDVLDVIIERDNLNGKKDT